MVWVLKCEAVSELPVVIQLHSHSPDDEGNSRISEFAVLSLSQLPHNSRLVLEGVCVCLYV